MEPGSLPAAERGFRQVGIKYTAQFPDLRLVWEWGYTCSFNLQSELIFPRKGSTLAEKYCNHKFKFHNPQNLRNHATWHNVRPTHQVTAEL